MHWAMEKILHQVSTEKTNLVLALLVYTCTCIQCIALALFCTCIALALFCTCIALALFCTCIALASINVED